MVLALLLLSGLGAVVLTRGGPGPAPGQEGAPAEEAAPVEEPAPGELGEPLVDPDDIIVGNPTKDGIPAIDEPQFLDPTEVDFLAPQEPVLTVEVNGDTRAYPLRIMMWHEIVNDRIGGVPVTVTYCPLCNTGIAFERPTVKGRLLDFGTSGKLYRSNLVMYDRQTDTYWAQATGQAILGKLAGMQLEFIPAQVVSWQDWRASNPNGRVLSTDTGFDRDYGLNPYFGYDDPTRTYPGLFEGELDDRMPPLTRVLGVTVANRAVAFPYPELEERAQGGWTVVQADVGGSPVLVLWAAGTVSALDDDEIPQSRDVGATGAFSPAVAGRELTFEVRPEGVVDRETGSRWNILGEAVSGPLQGTQLEPVQAVEHFWFSWAAFFPHTTIFGR